MEIGIPAVGTERSSKATEKAPIFMLPSTTTVTGPTVVTPAAVVALSRNS